MVAVLAVAVVVETPCYFISSLSLCCCCLIRKYSFLNQTNKKNCFVYRGTCSFITSQIHESTTTTMGFRITSLLSAALRNNPRRIGGVARRRFTTNNVDNTSEGIIVYDQVSKQPLLLTMFSIITTTSFVVLEYTRKEVPETAPLVIKVFGSPIWNYAGAALGVFGLFLSTKYPKFLVSEVRTLGKKVYVRTHTLVGHKTPPEVFDISDLVRIKSTSADYVNWKSLSSHRRFVLSKTDNIENLIQFGFTAASSSNTSQTLSNVGGKTLTEAELFEKALKERWTKKKAKKN